MPILEAYFNATWSKPTGSFIQLRLTPHSPVHSHPPGLEPRPLDWAKLSTQEDMFPARWNDYVKDPRTLRSHEVMMLYGMLFNSQDSAERFQFAVSWPDGEEDKDHPPVAAGQVFKRPGGALNVYPTADLSSDEEAVNVPAEQPARTPKRNVSSARMETPRRPASLNRSGRKICHPVFLSSGESESEDDGPVNATTHKSATVMSSPVKTMLQKRRATTATPTATRNLQAHPLGVLPALQPASSSPAINPFRTPSRHIIPSAAASQASTHESVPPKVSSPRFSPMNDAGSQADDDDLFGENITMDPAESGVEATIVDLFGEDIMVDPAESGMESTTVHDASGEQSESDQAAAPKGNKRKVRQGERRRSKR